MSIASDSLKLFPFSGDRGADESGKLLNEYNLSRIISGFGSVKDHVISATTDGTAYDFKVVVGGYYLELSNVTLPSGSTDSVYVAVDTEPEQQNPPKYPQINCQDEGGVFTAVSLTTSDDSTEYEKFLKILEKKDGDWIVPLESLKKHTPLSTGLYWNKY